MVIFHMFEAAVKRKKTSNESKDTKREDGLSKRATLGSTDFASYWFVLRKRLSPIWHSFTSHAPSFVGIELFRDKPLKQRGTEIVYSKRLIRRNPDERIIVGIFEFLLD